MIGKSSKGVSVSVVTLSFPTLKLSKSALKYVPAAPEFFGQPILKPPATRKDKKKAYTVESPIFLKVILINDKYALSKAAFFHFTYRSIVTLNISKLFMNVNND